MSKILIPSPQRHAICLPFLPTLAMTEAFDFRRDEGLTYADRLAIDYVADTAASHAQTLLPSLDSDHQQRREVVTWEG